MSIWVEFFSIFEGYWLFLWNFAVWGIRPFPIMVAGFVVSIVFSVVSLQVKVKEGE